MLWMELLMLISSEMCLFSKLMLKVFWKGWKICFPPTWTWACRIFLTSLLVRQPMGICNDGLFDRCWGAPTKYDSWQKHAYLSLYGPQTRTCIQGCLPQLFLVHKRRTLAGEFALLLLWQEELSQQSKPEGSREMPWNQGPRHQSATDKRYDIIYTAFQQRRESIIIIDSGLLEMLFRFCLKLQFMLLVTPSIRFYVVIFISEAGI